MADATLPEGLTADYANDAVREALGALQTDPSYEHLATFLTSLRDGYLFADVTGTQKKKSTRVRTIRSTQGQLLLPLFTSMNELRLAYPVGRRGEAKGALMPALEALRLIRTSAFVAAQFDAGSAQFVVLRKFIELALGDDEITSASFGTPE
ncbi:MAG: SseB family protein [Microbacteriaceae bacterium]|nr:SseB family protein [Microbacteriaceae bacterium]